MPIQQAPELRKISLNSLKAGTRLRGSVFDESSRLLIAAGNRVTMRDLAVLKRRGMTHVQIDVSQLANSQQQKGIVKARETANGCGVRKTAFLSLSTKKLDNPKNSKLNDEFHTKYAQSTSQVADVFMKLAEGREVKGEEVMSPIRECMNQIQQDLDLFVGMTPDTDQYPVSHSIQTARLAITMGALLDLDEKSLVDLGSGCILHDVGMLRISPAIVNSVRPLEEFERFEVAKHSIHTFQMISEVPQVSVGARMVAYQMHERLDGSGYPRKERGIRIHKLSKIAMIADVFTAMTSPRPHRPPMIPYYAIIELLQETAEGKFDQDSMRGLLDAVSMFPLGSRVQLSDDRIARVVRANPGCFNSPIVEIEDEPGDAFDQEPTEEADPSVDNADANDAEADADDREANADEAEASDSDETEAGPTIVDLKETQEVRIIRPLFG